MQERKSALLKSLQKKLRDLEIESVYRDGANEDLPTDILAVLLDDFGSDRAEVLGEFFFMPVPEGVSDETLYFNCVMTLNEDVADEMLPGLYEAVSTVNYFTQSGGFAVNKTGDMLVYRGTSAFPADMADDEILKVIFEVIDVSFAVAEQYIGVLNRVCDGRMSMEEFRGLFPDV